MDFFAKPPAGAVTASTDLSEISVKVDDKLAGKEPE
jgi:hypothetical protein